MAKIPRSQKTTATPPNPNSGQAAELHDILSMPLTGVLLTLNYLQVALSQSAVQTALFNSASPETVAHWLSALSEMGQKLTMSTCGRPRIQTFTYKGCLRISRTEAHLTAVSGEHFVMDELPFAD